MELDPAQRGAVESDHPRILVLAGAGTGKTRTLTHRVARLIRGGCPAGGVVLATFTNRAAHEMVARLRGLLGPDARDVRAGTFHALAHRAMRAHAPEIGWPIPRAILTPAEQQALMRRAAAGRAAGPARTLLEIYALALNRQIPLAAAVAERAPELEADRVAAAVDAYAEAKAAAHAADFDDLLLFLQAFLGHDGPAARAYRDGIRHVLVDEYQDVTPLQAGLADALAAGGAHRCVVGDDAQAIYGWRGADPGALARFAAEADTEIHALTRSYRCAPAVLAVANAIRPGAPLSLTPAARPEAPAPPVVVVEAPRPADQAAFVAQRIADRRAAGQALSDVAVLYRARRHALEVELALARWRLPFVTRSGPRRLDQPHLGDVVAALRVLVDPRDRLAWPRLLARIPGIGPRRAEAALETIVGAEDPPSAVRDAARRLPADATPGLFALAAALEALAEPPLEAGIRGLADPTGPAPLFGADELDAAARDEITRLAAWAGAAGDPRALLDALALDDPGGAPAPRAAVTTGTVHQAKGLEWGTVFVIGLDEGAFPLRRADDDPDAAEEERRLFYVAVTRARDALYLVSGGGGEAAYAPPSRFLTRVAGLSAVERWSLA